MVWLTKLEGRHDTRSRAHAPARPGGLPAARLLPRSHRVLRRRAEAGDLQRPARAAAGRARPGVHRGDGHRGRAAQRQGPGAVQPARGGGRRFARGRLPDRELAGDVPGRGGRAVREAAGRPGRADPGDVPPDQRPVDRLRGPVDGAGLQHRPGRGERAAGLDPRPRRPRVGRPHLVLADRGRLPGDRGGGPRARGRGGHPRVARGPQGQRHRLRRQQRRPRVGRLGGVRGRDRLPLLLGAGPQGERRGQRRQRAVLLLRGRTPGPSSACPARASSRPAT